MYQYWNIYSLISYRLAEERLKGHLKVVPWSKTSRYLLLKNNLIMKSTLEILTAWFHPLHVFIINVSSGSVSTRQRHTSQFVAHWTNISGPAIWKQECWLSNQITYCAAVEANSTSVWADVKVRVEGDGVWDSITVETSRGERRERVVYLSSLFHVRQLSLLHILLTGSPQHT